MNRAAQSSRTTHAAPQAIDACRYFAALLIQAFGIHKIPPTWRQQLTMHHKITQLADDLYQLSQEINFT